MKNNLLFTDKNIGEKEKRKNEGKEIEYKDMIGEFADGWLTAIDIADLKFDRNDEEKNKLKMLR